MESFIPATSGHRVGEQSLDDIGLMPGVGQDFDWVDAAGFATANLSNYTAIGVASSFGGMFTSAELNAMIARTADITAFINEGGGLFASAECDSGGACDASIRPTGRPRPRGPQIGGCTPSPRALFRFRTSQGLIKLKARSTL